MTNPCDEAAARAWEAFKAGRPDEATAICSEMLAHSPDHAGLLGVYGVIVGERGDIEAALQTLLRARSIAPDNPDWSFNLGIAYLRGGRLYEAKTALLEALRLRPRNIGYLIELAILHASLQEDRDTLAICLDVIAQEPGNADGHLLLAETLLRRGEMLLGWRAYSKGHRIRQDRQRIEASSTADLKTIVPRWNGGPSPDTSILLDCDQGFGETIQFARYVPLVAKQCRSVVLQTPIELIPLLSRIPDITVVPLGQEPEPAYTERAMVSELPGLFATTVGNIPGGISYLDADPARVHAWSERLTAFAGENRLRVGLMWAGQVINQRQALSCLTFDQLTSLLAVPNLVFISLQKQISSLDVDKVRCAPVLDLSAELTDFGETAAVLANLDLVISTDSCVAHLAGALGRKVWLLLPRPADWRWFRDRDDSPWYPTMQLFRQQTSGDWTHPLRRAAAELVSFASEAGAVPTVHPQDKS